MPYELNDKLVIGISSRALFDLEKENTIFEEQGLKAFQEFQLQNEDTPLSKGAAFPLIEALLKLNDKLEKITIEVIVMSKNSPETGLRAFNSIEHYGLPISRAAFSGGASLVPYLEAFSVDLFLSRSESDVQKAINNGVAAAILYDIPDGFDPKSDQIRMAFDGDAVVFSEESENIYKTQGLEKFLEHEKENANQALPKGPFAKLLIALSELRHQFEPENNPVRLALVTARNAPAHKRAILTLRAWNVYIDEAFFLGGVSKDKILKSYNAHIFFDDQDTHLAGSSKVVPSGRVPIPEQSTHQEPPDNDAS